jgi:hypothetical protein
MNAKLFGVSYLGSVNSSAKLVKNGKVSKQMTYVLYLAPANLSGYDVCKGSTPECRKGCLNTSGRSIMEAGRDFQPIQNARILKTKALFEQTELFMTVLVAEIRAAQRKAEKAGYGFSVRLNGTSDVRWSDIKLNGRNIFEIFSDVQFYDYTKELYNVINKPVNQHITWSYTGHLNNKNISVKLLSKGLNVAVVFNVKKGQNLPANFLGFPVVDGDLTDYRPNDGSGVVVGLRLKKIADKAAENEVRNSLFVVSI